MGVVYRARQSTTGNVVALKVLLARGRDASFAELARFRIEMEAMSCLDHPNILKIRDVGVVEGYPYFTTDFAGLELYLKDRIQGRPQPVSWSLKLVRSLAAALHYSHGRGMLHRDLKPANILFLDCGTPQIADFGLVKFTAPLSKVRQNCCVMPTPASVDEELAEELVARFVAELQHQYAPPSGTRDLDEDAEIRSIWQQCAARTGLLADTSGTVVVRKFVRACKGSKLPFDRIGLPSLDDLTRPGSVLGSPRYMAPEQTLGHHHMVGRHTDVYAMGVILYELLTGWPTFPSGGIAEVMEQVRSTCPTPPRRLRPEIPGTRWPEALCQAWRSCFRDLPCRLIKALSVAPVRCRLTFKIAGAESWMVDEGLRSWWPFRRKGSSPEEGTDDLLGGPPASEGMS